MSTVAIQTANAKLNHAAVDRLFGMSASAAVRELSSAAWLLVLIAASACDRGPDCTVVHVEVHNGTALTLGDLAIDFDVGGTGLGDIEAGRTAGGSWEHCPAPRTARLSIWDSAGKDRVTIPVTLPALVKEARNGEVSLRITVAADALAATVQVIR
jgi:hypothetical protein